MIDDNYIENQDFLNKVAKIAEVKYDIEYDVLTGFMFEINQCYKIL